jgi:peptide/nickel transport system permease protein
MEQADALRAQYGLDEPITTQYVLWVTNLLQGNLGVSLDLRQPVAEIISDRLPATLLLAGLSFVVTWVLAIPMGVISAVRQHSPLDYFFTIVSYVGVATPNFMIALILLWFFLSNFGVNLSGLQSSELVGEPLSWEVFVDLLAHLWIPVLILALDGTARLSRIMRANLLDELGKPYVEAARARGISEWGLIFEYPVRMALNPLISTIGWYLPRLFSGSLIVATVMNIPSIGPTLLRALTSQDMFLAGSILMVYSLLVLIGTLISDLLLALVDPRIRLEA